jgi:sterol desaturase/sphingolipid hydroxylase (fatty acid hydroxylase superfamily)
MHLPIPPQDVYQWKLSLMIMIASFGVPALAFPLIRLVPVLRGIQDLNRTVAMERRQLNFYQAVQRRSIFWGLTVNLLTFVLIVPFCTTMQSRPWWHVPRDAFVILMFYDFVYYLTHRFLFHDGGPGPGPLMRIHAIHHQNRNPCRLDSSYLHPLEILVGNGLYGFSLGFLAWLMGGFHAVTLTITSIAFMQINLHNHDLMEVQDRFPYRYLRHMSFMHHVHHGRFTAGNFATISLLYDWLFGTYDTGQGWRQPRVNENSERSVTK